MKLLPTLLLALTTLTAAAELGIETTHKVDCTRKTKKHDTIQMHYRGTLAADGSEFDASYKRNAPLRWDEGLLDMCVGEKRTLTIPPEYGYGNRGVGPIPAGSTLIFETELVKNEDADDEEEEEKAKVQDEL
ncbi:Peptidyl-prolyl cis-trans isomerase fpr2 [Aspergillus melleus]|uniref:Peptidyl-prolyl cis-trans isomerase fpr2 n=1 Tax=Aspergillus melleus TaxID=138277 RepID=A0ACC3BDW2_9EURO|nr:Peptidyl-prolyl cis-trans isomerase fpr2 [Aspergillus melleus]